MKISDPLPNVCPKCQVGGEIHKKITAAAFHLKGGGWYTDAYSTKKSSSGDKVEGVKADSTSSASSSEASSKSVDAPSAASAPKEKAGSPEKTNVSTNSTPKASEKKSSSPVNE